MPTDPLEQLVATAGQFHDVGKLREAEGLYRQALGSQPGRVDAMCGLGLLLSQTGRHQEAMNYLHLETVWKTASPLILTALATSMLSLGGVDGAIVCARRAVELDTHFVEGYNIMGCALLARGEPIPAVHALMRAVQLRPNYTQAIYNLGCALDEAGKPADAIEVYNVVLQLHPHHPTANLNRGFALRDLGRLDEAVASFTAALAARPDYSEAMHNLGATLAEKGRVTEGLQWIRRAIEANPNNFHAHGALIYLMNFDPESTTAAIAAEAQKWDARHASGWQFQKGPADTTPKPTPEKRRLRIGYVSPDFRAHAESWFLLPLLQHHDRSDDGFEIHCYSSVLRPDAVTEKMRPLADAWHDVKNLSDHALAEKIRSDGIDILVDLTMHMEGHRLLTFARHPAPVQIAWLAYPGGTGLRTMTHRITDPLLDPPSADNPFPEIPLRLPHAWFCFQPSPEAPAVNPLPAANSSTITFGSLNTYRKMSPPVMHLWARTMAAVENATGKKTQLLLTCPAGDHREELFTIFRQHGIAAEQLHLLERQKYADYLATYRQIDIALDPFPHNGATTTCEALHMGVPVLTLRGHTHAGRLGQSILTTLNLPDWIAHAEEDFIQKAATIAQNLSTLSTLRSTLRQQLLQSPLTDAPTFTKNMETIYRQTQQNV